MADIWTRVYRVFESLRPPPVEELERFYAERQVPIAHEIAEAIRMSQGDVKVVLTGQKGSGKTTELMWVAQKLKEEFFPVWLDVESRLNIFNVNHLEVLIGATATMFKTAEEKGITLDKTPLDRITETINKVTRKRGLSLELSREKIKGLDPERLRFLCRIYEEKPPVLPSEGIREEVRSELQAALYILYYEDGGQWYWTHPVLEDFLEEQCPKKSQ